jgi:hypothetical protein
MAKKPEERYVTASELALDFSNTLVGFVKAQEHVTSKYDLEQATTVIGSQSVKKEELDAMWLDYDLADLEIKKFLARSGEVGLSLQSIDVSVLTWQPPLEDKDFGWKTDNDTELEFVNKKLIDDELERPLREISERYNHENPKQKNSVRYRVVEYVSGSPESGGKLILRVRPVIYFTSFPIADVLKNSLIPQQDEIKRQAANTLRAGFFDRLKARERPLLPNMLVAQVLVVTGDNKLLLQ